MTLPALPFVDLQAQRRRIASELDAALQRVLDHGTFIMGPEVAQLEGELARFCGVRHCVSCSSGTDALLLPLLSWGIGPGDAVLVPAFTFPATPEVVALLGATPVFVDVDADTFNVSPQSVADCLDMLRRDHPALTPRTIVPVDLYGLPAAYDELGPIADEAGVRILSDAAQSFGAALGEQRVGTFGAVTATSFFPAKPLGCYGDGGAVLTDDDELAASLRSLRAHGQGTDKYDIVAIGINGRLDTMQAAVLLVKLTIYEDELRRREAVATRYTAALEGHVEVPKVPPGVRSTWAQYTIRIPNRDDVAARLRAAGVPTAVYYPRPLHQQPAYRNAVSAPSLAVSERLAREVLSLPMHPYLEEPDQQRVIDAVLTAVG